MEQPEPRTFNAPGAAPAPEEEAPRSANLLDDLRADLSAEVAPEPVWCRPPLRQPPTSKGAYSVIHRVPTDYDEMADWNRKATFKAQGLNDLRLAELVLINTCTAIRRDGEDTGLTYLSDDFVAMLGALEPLAAVRAFYGSDGDLLQDAQAVLAAGSWVISAGGRVERAAGPTKG